MTAPLPKEVLQQVICAGCNAPIIGTDTDDEICWLDETAEHSTKTNYVPYHEKCFEQAESSLNDARESSRDIHKQEWRDLMRY